MKVNFFLGQLYSLFINLNELIPKQRALSVMNFKTFLFQTLLSGQGLNDNQWHTIAYSRRADHLHLKVDAETPVTGIFKSTIKNFGVFTMVI